MLSPQSKERLSAYRQWRTRVANGIAELGRWLEQNQLADEETRTWMRAALTALDTERLTVAFLPAAGRNAADLINALFFHDKERRLPASPAGRDEACPIEVSWDPEDGEASLRLLPIETLGLAIPFRQLRANPAHWVAQPLALASPEQVAQQLRQASQTKVVPHGEAVRLGLAGPGPREAADAGPVQIPKWRHAIVSFPSSLLRLGLTVVAVPDPRRVKVATDVLAQAQVAVCILPADRGDVAAELDRWRQYFGHSGVLPKEAMVVALDQPDQGPESDGGDATERGAPMGERRRAIAAELGIDPSQVFPLSAQLALRARAEGDLALVQYTGVPPLEAYIAAALPQAKQRAQADQLTAGLAEIVSRSRLQTAARIDRAKARLTALAALRDKQNVLIARMLEQTRREQEVYVQGVQRFQADRNGLALETKRCREILDGDRIGALIEQTHAQMAHSWTTSGMVGAMIGLFSELRRAMQIIGTESERVREWVHQTYARFQRDFGVDLVVPKVFAPMTYRVEIELLHQDAETFLHGPGLILTEQGTVIRRFHETMISRAQVLFDQLRAAFETWTHDTLQPLAAHIERHKIGMQRRLDDLLRLEQSNAETQRHIDQTQAQYVDLARQLTELRNIQATLRQELGPAAPADVQNAPAGLADA